MQSCCQDTCSELQQKIALALDAVTPGTRHGNIVSQDGGVPMQQLKGGAFEVNHWRCRVQSRGTGDCSLIQ